MTDYSVLDNHPHACGSSGHPVPYIMIIGQSVWSALVNRCSWSLQALSCRCGVEVESVNHDDLRPLPESTSPLYVITVETAEIGVKRLSAAAPPADEIGQSHVDILHIWHKIADSVTIDFPYGIRTTSSSAIH